MPQEPNKTILRIGLVKFWDAGNSIVPKTSKAIAAKRIKYKLIYEFNSGSVKVSNWIEFKIFANKIISYYAG